MTAQIHENLLYEGRETSIAFCPPIPVHPRIIEIDPASADRGPEDGNPHRVAVLFSTACWRGYQGSWEIRAGRFYLAAAPQLTLRSLGTNAWSIVSIRPISWQIPAAMPATPSP